MIVAPEGANNEHLETLSKLSVLLMNPDFKDELFKTKSSDEVLKLIDKFEENEEVEEVVTTTESLSKGLILGVTACLTETAHTYMVADPISMGYSCLCYRFSNCWWNSYDV